MAAEKQVELPKDGQINMILPIDWTAKQKVDLLVRIPQGFRCLQSSAELSKDTTKTIEFIPANEKDNQWTEIITIHKFLGKQLQADSFTAQIIDYLFSQVTDLKVWKDLKFKEPAYLHASFGITYNYQGKHELLGAHYYSGPYDCVGVQYSIRAKGGESDKKAIAKMEDYFKENVRVLTSSKS